MTFAHMELNTSDPNAAKKFYKGVFGWKTEDMKMPGGVYTMVSDATGKGFGGIQKNPMPGAPAAWLGYVVVPSVKRACAKIEKRGGKIVVPPTEIPNMGTFSIFVDPQGATAAIWEEAKPAKAPKKASKKKASKKKAAKKKPAKKASKKKAAKKKPAKKASKKKAAKKPAKKASKKKTAKKK